MPKFRFVVQIYKTLDCDGVDEKEAREKCLAKLRENILKKEDKFFIPEPKNLDRKK